MDGRIKLIDNIIYNDGQWCDFCNDVDAYKVKKIIHTDITIYICEDCLRNTCEQFWDDEVDEE